MKPETLHDHYLLTLGGVVLSCDFAFPETAKYFGNYCKGPLDGNGTIKISDWFWKKVSANIGPKIPYIEYTVFSVAASVALLGSDRVLIHSAAFRWNDQAWLITGPSGIGKSTHIRTLQEQHGNEFSVICGDRPVLQKNEDGSFFVHPSPWNGKERWHGAEGATLSGIICLKRGNADQIEVLPTKAAAPLLFTSILQTGEYEEDVRKAASLEEALLNSVPVLQLTSSEPVSSATLLYNTLFSGND